jgi:hypothetical protein
MSAAEEWAWLTMRARRVIAKRNAQHGTDPRTWPTREQAEWWWLQLPQDPDEVTAQRRRDLLEATRECHRPSLVLELPPGHMAWLACSQPWPCPQANTTHTTHEGTTNE